MSADRRAVLVLLALGAAGVLVRLLFHSSGPEGAVAYRAPETPRSSLDTVAARASRLARPLRRGETIDLDRASAEDLARLPRIGPGLAARMVAEREAHGPFGSLDGLHRVSGLGPSTLEAVRPYAAFSRPASVSPDMRGGVTNAGGRLPVCGLVSVLNEPIPPDSPLCRGVQSPTRPPVSLNTAPADSIAQLPGLGPIRARAIVEDRTRRGAFRTVEDLTRVPGIGRGTLVRLQGLIRVP